jgi:Transcriptional regulator, AbiEi antitoxin
MADKRRAEGRHRPLAELAARQHGVVSAGQLRELGYSRDQISDAAATGRLQRLQRGVFAVGHRGLAWEGHCLATVLASAPALASHASAGRVWGLLRYEPATIDITASSGRRHKPHTRIHRAELTASDEAACAGIPVTSVARTVLDLAATIRPDRLEKVLERAEELRIFDLAAVDELLPRATRHRGSPALREALAAHRDAPAFVRSGLERRFLALVDAAGLPPPSMNFNVGGFELDAFWLPERFAVELDVYETHGGRAAFERDRLRHEELKLIGVEMVRITGLRLDREPDRVMGRIGVLLRRRRDELGVRRRAGAVR